MVIYSHYDPAKAHPRGTLANGVFYRDHTPLLWGTVIALEPDVIQALRHHGCTHLEIALRTGETLRLTLEEFVARSSVKMAGGRLQHLVTAARCPKKNT